MKQMLLLQQWGCLSNRAHHLLIEFCGQTHSLFEDAAYKRSYFNEVGICRQPTSICTTSFTTSALTCTDIGLKQILPRIHLMAITTTLESKYVVLARLHTFLNREFPGQYMVKVMSFLKSSQIALTNTKPGNKIDGDFVEISAPRLLT